MKRYLAQLFVLLLPLCWGNCFANCRCPEDEIRFIPCPKTYTTPDQVILHENGIFVRMNDCILQAESLSTDAQGIFFENVKDVECGAMQWKCKKPIYADIPCNTCNWIWYNNCLTCGKARGVES